MYDILSLQYIYSLFISQIVKYQILGVVNIEIEIKERSKFKEFFRKVHNKAEDIFFSIIQRLPERFIPSFIMEWLARYTDRRINELKHQQIKATWQKMYLQDHRLTA